MVQPSLFKIFHGDTPPIPDILFSIVGLLCDMCTCVCQSFRCVRLFATLWTVVHQVPLSMEFSRPEYWSGLPFSSPGALPHPGMVPGSPSLQGDSLASKPIGKPSGSQTWNRTAYWSTEEVQVFYQLLTGPTSQSIFLSSKYLLQIQYQLQQDRVERPWLSRTPDLSSPLGAPVVHRGQKQPSFEPNAAPFPPTPRCHLA